VYCGCDSSLGISFYISFPLFMMSYTYRICTYNMKLIKTHLLHACRYSSELIGAVLWTMTGACFFIAIVYLVLVTDGFVTGLLYLILAVFSFFYALAVQVSNSQSSCFYRLPLSLALSLIIIIIIIMTISTLTTLHDSESNRCI
jgi:hypothetical protein